MIENYEQYMNNKKDKSKIPFKIFERAKPVHIILFAVLFFVGTLLAKNNSKTWMFIVFGILAVVYLFSVMKQEPETKAIPRHIAEEIARKDLLMEIAGGRAFMQGTEVNPTSYFRDQAWDSGDGPKIFKYHIGFIVKEPNRGPKDIIYQMNPFTGESKGIVEAPLGFSGQEIKDIQMIFPDKVIKEEKKDL